MACGCGGGWAGRCAQYRHNTQPLPLQDLLPHLHGELRHHQLAGVTWLASLYANGLNGVLADELEADRAVREGWVVAVHDPTRQQHPRVGVRLKECMMMTARPAAPS